MLTIWVAEFLQCAAHGCFDSQVPPFGAHSGGPGWTDREAMKGSVFLRTIFLDHITTFCGALWYPSCICHMSSWPLSGLVIHRKGDGCICRCDVPPPPPIFTTDLPLLDEFVQLCHVLIIHYCQRQNTKPERRLQHHLSVAVIPYDWEHAAFNHIPCVAN